MVLSTVSYHRFGITGNPCRRRGPGRRGHCFHQPPVLLALCRDVLGGRQPHRVTANDLLRPIHDRMPVILPKENVWLLACRRDRRPWHARQRADSPSRTIPRTFVWAWFELPQPVSRRNLSESIRQERRNPVALALDWQQHLDSGKFALRAELTWAWRHEGPCHTSPEFAPPRSGGETVDPEPR